MAKNNPAEINDVKDELQVRILVLVKSIFVLRFHTVAPILRIVDKGKTSLYLFGLEDP